LAVDFEGPRSVHSDVARRTGDRHEITWICRYFHRYRDLGDIAQVYWAVRSCARMKIAVQKPSRMRSLFRFSSNRLELLTFLGDEKRLVS
jgi:hypothetical protein